MDWSHSIRLSGCNEYLLIGPQDTGRSGHLVNTWGGPTFGSRGRPLATPPWAPWCREDLRDMSRLVLGSEDAPGRVGTMGVVAFRKGLGARRGPAAAELLDDGEGAAGAASGRKGGGGASLEQRRGVACG